MAIKQEMAAPHIRRKRTTSAIMTDVVIALLPICVWAVWLFRWQAAAVLVTTTAVCVLAAVSYTHLLDDVVGDGEIGGGRNFLLHMCERAVGEIYPDMAVLAYQVKMCIRDSRRRKHPHPTSRS